MPDRPLPAVVGRPLAALAGLFLVTLALRPQLIGVGPLVPAIQADLGISHAAAGLLSTIPVLCMGVFAPLGPWVAGRIGPRFAVGLCVTVIVAFGLVRAVVPGAPLVLAATLLIGIGMGTAGAVLPIIVKQRAGGVPALATGAYAAGIVAGALVSAAVAVPLAEAFGTWRAPLLLFALVTAPSLVAWLVLLRPDPAETRATGRPPRLPWGDRTAWVLIAVFGLQSLLYYSAISWLPAIYVERGWSEADAGALIAVLHLVGLATGVGVPLVADRLGSRRGQLVTVAAAVLVGYVGIALVPGAAALWAAVLGFGLGAIFPLCLTLPVDVADRPAEVGAIAAFMLLGGYIVSSLGPVTLGLLRDASGAYTIGIWLLVALAAVLTGVCAALSPARLRRGVGGSRAGAVAGS